MPDVNRIKADAFDRIAAAYRELSKQADFYSKNWLLLSEVIDAELKRVQAADNSEPSGTGFQPADR